MKSTFHDRLKQCNAIHPVLALKSKLPLNMEYEDGGAIINLNDKRNGLNYDIYVQRYGMLTVKKFVRQLNIYIDYIIKRFNDLNLPLLGKIPEDNIITEFEIKGKPIIDLPEKSKNFLAVNKIADDLFEFQ